MENTNPDINKYLLQGSKSLKDYIRLVQVNLSTFILICLIITVSSILYAFLSEDIYKSTVTLKIMQQQKGILESKGLPEIGDLVNDRFIANEIEVIKNYDIREMYGKALIDSFSNSKNKALFSYLIVKDTSASSYDKKLKYITNLLKRIVSAEQINGIDVVEISAESPSPYEAALIANTCAAQYRQFNLESNRNLLSNIRRFLGNQSKEKLKELNIAEDTLKSFQEKGKIISLDAQSTALIKQLSELDAQRDAAKIELMTSNEALNQYKSEIKRQDPHLAENLESQTSQAYIEALQKQLAELQITRDLAVVSKNINSEISTKLKDYDRKISELKNKLTELINNIKTDAFASSPEQIKDLTQKLIEEEVNNHSLNIKLRGQESIIRKYEENFNMLPKKSIELAQYERKRESLQHLYIVIEQKYQESMINELSQPGNIIIIGKGRIPDKPFKPNRTLLIIMGLLGGLVSSFCFLLVKDYLNERIKSPFDIQNKNIKVLTWIPHFKTGGNNGSQKFKDFLKNDLDPSVREAFRALRIRLVFSNLNHNPLKTVLVTSPAEKEGKTVVSNNLALSFALANKKTLLIDCDLRKPRVHSIMGVEKAPGLSDYFSNRATIERILRCSEINNLQFITSGTIPPDPPEILGSPAMKTFLKEMQNRFDMVILDSPPVVAVVDSEILSKIVDGTVLVVSADKTVNDLMEEAVSLVKNDKSTFLGVILNNFNYKNGYGYYKKYYYSYPSERNIKNKS
ncbi:MAG: GumC family protein [Syntrophomonadaceae bacterium]